MPYRLAAKPSASINAACDGWNDTHGAYRFFMNENVNAEDILKPHREATHRRLDEQKVVLVVQDTTDLNYSDHPPDDARHLNRFETPAGKGIPVEAFYAQRYANFKAATDNAQATSTQDVDPDLIAMVNRHRVLDAAEFQLLDAAKALAAEMGLKPNETPIEQHMAFVDTFFADLREEEFDKLPPRVQDLLTVMVDVQDARIEQFHEIEVMEARMSERYEGRSFSLPSP